QTASMDIDRAGRGDQGVPVLLPQHGLGNAASARRPYLHDPQTTQRQPEGALVDSIAWLQPQASDAWAAARCTGVVLEDVERFRRLRKLRRCSGSGLLARH